MPCQCADLAIGIGRWDKVLAGLLLTMPNRFASLPGNLGSFEPRGEMVQSHRLLACISTAAMLGGCSSWQDVLWKNEFIPLPELAVMRVVDQDEKGNPKLATGNLIVGRFRVPRAEDFVRSETPWLWNEISTLTESGVPVRPTQGAESYVKKIGLKLEVEALTQLADVTVAIGPSKSLQLSKFWFLEPAPLSPNKFDLAFRPLVGELGAGPERKSYFLITKVLAADIGDPQSVSFKVGAKFKDERFPIRVGLDGGGNWEFTGHGVALGVQGQIVTRQLRGGPPKELPISLGDKDYDFVRDVIVIDRDGKDWLDIKWKGIEDVEIFARVAGGELKKYTGRVPPKTSFLLVGNLKGEEGHLLAMQLVWRKTGPAILAGATYDIAMKPLNATSLQAFFSQGDATAPIAPAAPVIDREAWRNALGDEQLFKEFVPLQTDALAIQLDKHHASIERYEIVDVFAPVSDRPDKLDFVHMTRYDVRGLAGKNFTYQVFRSSSVGMVRARIWAQLTDGRIMDITPDQQTITSLTQTVAIPAGVDYLLLRASVRRERNRSNITGFYGPRQFGPVQQITWNAAFVAPLGKQCRVVLGIEKPEPAMLGRPSRGKIPPWASDLLAKPAEEFESELRNVQAYRAQELDICHFSLPDVGLKAGYLGYGGGR
jgi:hypothetical protein